MCRVSPEELPPRVTLARNQAEDLRLLLGAVHIPAVSAELKPFALVVEDDVANCDALTEALKTRGRSARSASTAEVEAVRLARSLNPDLVVIDYRLPDITGAEVCRRRGEDPETEGLPVIAVIGFARRTPKRWMPQPMQCSPSPAVSILLLPQRACSFRSKAEA